MKSNELNIIYEDDDVLVVNKQPDISVHEGVKTGETLVDLIVEHYPEIISVGDPSSSSPQGELGSEQVNFRPGIVHRLDKETSGVMVVAKNNEVFEFLKVQFQDRQIEKKYLVLVKGIVKDKEGVMESFIGRMGDKQVSVKTEEEVLHRKAKIKNLKKAVTEYKVVKYFDEYTLCEALPKTGRMHQIRVHFKSIGHVVAGDKKYSPKGQENVETFSRQFLHAAYLSFSLPNGKKMAFEADLPEDLTEVLKKLEK